MVLPVVLDFRAFGVLSEPVNVFRFPIIVTLRLTTANAGAGNFRTTGNLNEKTGDSSSVARARLGFSVPKRVRWQ